MDFWIKVASIVAVGVLSVVYWEWLWRAQRHCPHSDLEGIYGDSINHCGGYRLRCRTCGAWLRGPVRLARSRRSEVAVEKALDE